jgi:inner membrane protein
MYAMGHYGIVLMMVSPVLYGLLATNMYLTAGIFTVSSFITATLPDIDLKFPMNRFVSHRGFTHTIWFACIVGVIATLCVVPFVNILSESVAYTMGIVFTGTVFGVFAHILGDVITPTGITPFAPFGQRYSYHITTAKGIWWFETIESGAQSRLTGKEELRHAVLNSNRFFFMCGSLMSFLGVFLALW